MLSNVKGGYLQKHMGLQALKMEVPIPRIHK